MKLAFLGDIALFGSFGSIEDVDNIILDQNGNKIDFFSRFDHVIANFEAPFSIERKRWRAKSAYLYSSPLSVDVLKKMHVDFVNLANNHMFDYGFEGYELTKKILTDNGLKWFGSEGVSQSICDDTNKIRFEGFCCRSSNPLNLVEYGRYGINELTIDTVDNLLKRNASEGFITVLSVHSGIEHINYPSITSIKMARHFAGVCPYIYIGHHPHVLQGYEYYQESFISHSLGNFIFDDIIDDNINVIMSPNNRESTVLELELDGNKIVNYQYTPVIIGKGKLIIFEQSNSCVDKYNFDRADFSPNEYSRMRKEIINQRMHLRAENRNLKWFIKRLRPKYAELLITNFINSRKYYSNIVSKFQ